MTQRTCTSQRAYIRHTAMFGFKEMTGMDKFFQQLDDDDKEGRKRFTKGVDI